jgi:hypothetical protein
LPVNQLKTTEPIPVNVKAKAWNQMANHIIEDNNKGWFNNANANCPAENRSVVNQQQQYQQQQF